MGITYSDPDVAADENIVQIAALTPTDNAVIIGNGTAWTTESGSTLLASLGLAIGSDVMAYDADLAAWAGVNPADYLTTAAAASTYLTTSAAALAYQPLDADLTAWAGVNPSSYSTTAQIAAAYQPLDSDLTAWAAVNPSSYSTTAQIAAAYQPLDADLTSWAAVTRAAGFDAFAATPTSANLRTLLSDESGSGVLLFAGGALGTPASGVLTNCTGLPNASVVGLGTAALVADNTLMHLSGTETVTGAKTFNGQTLFASTTGGQSAVKITGNGSGTGAGTSLVGHNGGVASWGIGNHSSIYTGGAYDNEFTIYSASFVYNTINSGGAKDPIMTRGATETVTGLKTFTSTIPLSFARSAHDNWQIVQGTSSSTRGIGWYNATDGAYAWFVSDTENLGVGTTDPSAKLHVVGGGVVVGSPTGGDKGAGVINAQAVYDDNVLLSCYVLDAALDGTVDMEKWDANVPDREIPAVYRSETKTIDGKEVSEQTLLESAKTETRLHEPARKFTARLGTKYDPLTLEGYEAHWREKRHLTAFPNEAKFDPIKDAHSTGEWLQRLIENAEIQAVLIAKLHAKVAALEAAA